MSIKASFRHQAREYAVQAVYQWQIADGNAVDIEKQFMEDFNFKKTDHEYFQALLHGILQHAAELDTQLKCYLDRDISALGPVELAILRLSAYELMYRLDVPYKVVINESINLGKDFGAVAAHKYINGVLDKLAQQTRKLEINAVSSR